jgi:hypothetical protein
MDFSTALAHMKNGRSIRRRSSDDRRCYRLCKHPGDDRSWIRYGDWPNHNDYTGFSNADILAGDWVLSQDT